MGFSQQEYWSELPLPLPGDFPNSGIEPTSPASPALAGGFLTIQPPGKPVFEILIVLLKYMHMHLFTYFLWLLFKLQWEN